MVRLGLNPVHSGLFKITVELMIQTELQTWLYNPENTTIIKIRPQKTGSNFRHFYVSRDYALTGQNLGSKTDSKSCEYFWNKKFRSEFK